jgi:hypothetical protein
MTKQQQWNAIEEVLQAYPTTPKALKNALAELLKPKGSRGASNPPKLDENGKIVAAWCRHHQQYEPAEDMILYADDTKSKGLCKAASRRWHQLNSEMKAKQADATKALIDGNAEEAMALAKASKEIEATLNEPETYNYEADWQAFKEAEAAKAGNAES